jgi:hypothetical protein
VEKQGETMMKKTDEQVNAIMAAIPEGWRKRWCGGERGLCACFGCVQIGNKAVIAEEISGVRYEGDPERISESALMAHTDVYAENKVSREEWDAWIKRQDA